MSHYKSALILICFLVFAGSNTGTSDDKIQVLIKNLNHDDFKTRELSTNTLVKKSTTQLDAVIKALLVAEKSNSPETKSRATSTIKMVYMRTVLEYGAPEHGLEFKSKLISVDNESKSCACIKFIDKNSAAEESNLKIDDCILSINGVNFDHKDGIQQLSSFLNIQDAGAEMKVILARKIDGIYVKMKTRFNLGLAEEITDFDEEQQLGFDHWFKEVSKRVKQSE